MASKISNAWPWAPRPSALLSLLSSLLVIRETIHPGNARRHRNLPSINNCVRSVAICDCIGSFAMFFTTWAMPADYNQFDLPQYGNQATCTAQGFLMDFGFLGNALFGVNLSVLYVLLIRYNMPEAKLQRFFYWSRIVVWGICIVYCTFFLSMGNYNPLVIYCWNTSKPSYCLLVDGVECERGSASLPLQRFIKTFSLFFPLALQIFLSGWLYRSVYDVENQQENRRQSTLSNFSFHRSSSIHSQNPTTVPDTTPQATVAATATANRSRSNAVVVRALLYNAGFALSIILAAVVLIVAHFFGKYSPSSVYVLMYCFYCSQGIWMLLAFMKNREMLTREGKFVKHTLCCCLYYHENKQTTSRRAPTHPASGGSSRWGRSSGDVKDSSGHPQISTSSQIQEDMVGKHEKERPVSDQSQGNCALGERSLPNSKNCARCSETGALVVSDNTLSPEEDTDPNDDVAASD